MILHPAKHLTDNYKKDSDSNNYKLLSIGYHEHLEILESLTRIEASRDIDLAFGFTLDKAGKNVLELRNGRSDEIFRQAIKIKILNNLSAGTIEDINTISSILFGEYFLSVQETWSQEQYNYEPAALFLLLADNPDAQEQFFYYIRNIVMAVKAGGVRLYNKILSELPNTDIYMRADAFENQRITIQPKTIDNKTFSGVLYTDAKSLDSQYISIRPKTLKNKAFSNSLYTGTKNFDSQHMSVQPKMLKSKSVTGMIYASAGTFDSRRMNVPAKTLADNLFHNTLYKGGIVFNSGYMKIPTGAIRESPGLIA